MDKNVSENQTSDSSPFFFTRGKEFIKKIERRAFASSLFPFYQMSGCCSPEYIYSLLRTGNIPTDGDLIKYYSPQQSDLLVITGCITIKTLPVLLDTYDEMLEPKWVFAVGSCALGKGPYKNYNLINNLHDYISIDCSIEGCPPRADDIIAAMSSLRKKILIRD